MKKAFFLFLTMLLSFSSFAAADFKCAGTEPFWSVKVAKGFLKFSNPATDKTEAYKVLSTTVASGYSEDSAFIVKSLYSRLTVLSGLCGDGMSDILYNYTALFETESGIVYAGCCNKISE